MQTSGGGKMEWFSINGAKLLTPQRTVLDETAMNCVLLVLRFSTLGAVQFFLCREGS